MPVKLILEVVMPVDKLSVVAVMEVALILVL